MVRCYECGRAVRRDDACEVRQPTAGMLYLCRRCVPSLAGLAAWLAAKAQARAMRMPTSWRAM